MGDDRGVRFRLAAFYFFAFGGLGGVLPFLPLVLERRGLDAYAISAVMLLLPISNVLSPPFWGWLADTFSIRVALIRATGVGCAVGVLLLLPDLKLAGAIAGMTVYCFFRAPIIPLADAASYAALGARSDFYARIRVWGSVGFAVMATTMGAFDGSEAPTVLFGVTAIVYVLATATTFGVDAPPLSRNRGVLGQTIAVIRGTTLPLMFVASALYYVGHGAYDVYFGLHMKALGHSDAFVGVAWTVGVTCEIVVMFVAPRLLRDRSGAWFMAVGGAASIVRWSLLSVVTSAPAVLATQSLHALTFGLWYVSLVKFVQAKAPDELRTSVQGLAQAAMAVGMIGGYVGGAVLYERFGGVSVFHLATTAAVLAFLVYVQIARAERRDFRPR